MSAHADPERAHEGAALSEAKLAPPRPRAGLVTRPRLSAALDAGNGHTTTLVAAPPGYGKTTAVRAWCADRHLSPAWVTLDVGDNDPYRLWSYVATAVERVQTGLGWDALQRLSDGVTPVESAVDALTNAIATAGAEVVVVLDEVQALSDGQCLATIDHALRRFPPASRLILVSRSDPGLSLARLRGRGDLLELRADELAFTLAEARQLVDERAGIGLGPDEVEVLWERTEGWPAPLVLACAWLRQVDDATRAVRDFGGSHRFIVDYLTDEVLASLDRDDRSLLLSASVLGRFTPALCDGVLGRSDSAELLDRLERSNLFVTRLERGGWFRVHSLFAQFAASQLESEEPGAGAAIHARASAWLRSRDRPVEAAEHAAAAGDHEVVAQLLVENHLSLIRTGRTQSLLRWVRMLPNETVVDHPVLAVGAATASLMAGQSTLEQRRFLHLADRAYAAHPERVGPYVQAVSAMVRAGSVDVGVGKAVAEGRRAVELAESNADEILVAALAALARALYFEGELDESWATAMRAVEHPDVHRRAPGHVVARATLALVAADRKRMRAARTHAEKARELIGTLGASRSWIGANASVALGSVLAGEGAYPAAERELAYAEHFFRDEVATVHHAWLLAVLAGIRCRRGRLNEAAATLRSALEEIADLGDPGRVLLVAEEVGRELDKATSRVSDGDMLELPSASELVVLRLLGSDLTVRQIGGELFLSPNTIRSHTRSLYRKLGVNSRGDAVARAEALGLIGGTESPM